MGVVYTATMLALERRVALKVIQPEFAEDSQFRERFKRESRIAASIDHPHVIPIYHAGEEGTALYITMRFVDGTDLRRLVGEVGRLDPLRSVMLVSQVASALDAAHASGLVHRDVKPANVLLAPGDHAFLTDFGLTKLITATSGMTATGALVGTIDYVAPEQIAGAPLDARADVYALGCVLFHLVTGRVPYPRDNHLAKLYAHASEPPPSAVKVVPDLPPALDRALTRAMAKDPDQRHDTAGAFAADALAALEDDVPTSTRVRRPGGPPPAAVDDHASKLGRRRAGAATALAALLAAGGAIAVWSGDNEPERPEQRAPDASETRPTAATEPKGEPPSTRAVMRTIEAYARAVRKRDHDAVRAALAPGFELRVLADPPRDAEQFVRYHRRRFDDPRTRPSSFRLRSLRMETIQGKAIAGAGYSIEVDVTAPDPPDPTFTRSGSMTFEMVRDGRGALIEKLRIIPDITRYQLIAERFSARLAVRAMSGGRTIGRTTTRARGFEAFELRIPLTETARQTLKTSDCYTITTRPPIPSLVEPPPLHFTESGLGTTPC